MFPFDSSPPTAYPFNYGGQRPSQFQYQQHLQHQHENENDHGHQLRKHSYPPDHRSLTYYYPFGCNDYPSQDNARKRQRRQAAGNLVMQTLFNGSGQSVAGGKKKASTAQPRPNIRVPPRGIGPIRDPNCNDVLSGRGGRINAHPGNVQFRDLVQAKKKVYLDPNTKKLEKAHIAATIVQDIRTMDPPGRFLKEDADGSWYDIGDAKAIKKVGQALREDAPDIRQELKENSSDEEGDEADHKTQCKEVPPQESVAPRSASNSPVPENKISAPSPKIEPMPVTDVASTLSPQSKTKPAPLSPPQTAGVTVSRRGAKTNPTPVKSPPAATAHQPPPSQPAYKTLAYQEIAPPPSYQQMVPPQHGMRAIATVVSTAFATPSIDPAKVEVSSLSQGANFYGRGGFRGIVPMAGTAFSGAAAAAMRQHDDSPENAVAFEIPSSRDVAFGRAFHPPRQVEHGQNESSLLSGLSGPSMISGISSISGLSDNLSSLTENDAARRAAGGASLHSYHHHAAPHYHHHHHHHHSSQTNASQRLSQLQHLRQQWAAQQPPSNSLTTDVSSTRHLLHGSAGLGSSLLRSQSWQDVYGSQQQPQLQGFEDMSIASNSLIGGGIRGDSILAGSSVAGSVPHSGANVGNYALASLRTHSHGRDASMARGDEMETGEDEFGPAGGGPSRSSRNTTRTRSAASTPRMGPMYQPYYPTPTDTSVASMSINSGAGSMPSVPGSVMSELSDTLVALDLAEASRRQDRS